MSDADRELKRDMENDSEREAKPQCDGKWNGYYIEASQEVYDKLRELGYSPYSEETESENFDYFEIDTDFEILGTYKNCLCQDLKPFYLADGEFTETKPTSANNAQVEINSMEDLNELYIVGEEEMLSKSKIPSIAQVIAINKQDTISIKDDNGKEYKFEKPEFECELFRVTNQKILNGSIFGYVIGEHNPLIPIVWNKNDGNAYNCYSNEKCSKYNLTPIKPKWYEDESNFPALIVSKKTNELMHRCKGYDKKSNLLMVAGGSKADVNGWRLATKEEIDSLFYQDKE